MEYENEPYSLWQLIAYIFIFIVLLLFGIVLVSFGFVVFMLLLIELMNNFAPFIFLSIPLILLLIFFKSISFDKIIKM